MENGIRIRIFIQEWEEFLNFDLIITCRLSVGDQFILMSFIDKQNKKLLNKEEWDFICDNFVFTVTKIQFDSDKKGIFQEVTMSNSC